MEWNDINVLRLIELYREREVLWSCKLKEEYKNKNKRHDALLEIAVSFGVSKEEDDGTVDIENKEATEELREDKVGENRPAILTQGPQVGTTSRALPKGHTSRGRQQNLPVINEAINLMKSLQSRKVQDRDEFSAFELFEAKVGQFPNSPPPLSHHNPTAIYNTNLPLNIPPQFQPYCSPIFNISKCAI
ncbi:hypothetical protein FQA39_LY07147 [Lamprigera yunnana]|nr:hypothetical protein FQA39_LY07147 [Lamprigera yunnana]